MLTIAGYGSGNYRAASGLCTQYVAPGTRFPYEMVEVAVSARQGDSGGPIFNSRGELAGVLFGEGGGRTSGSYCGRVRWFLSSVVPSVAPGALPGSPAAVALAGTTKPPQGEPPQARLPNNPSRSVDGTLVARADRSERSREVALAGGAVEPKPIAFGLTPSEGKQVVAHVPRRSARRSWPARERAIFRVSNRTR